MKTPNMFNRTAYLPSASIVLKHVQRNQTTLQKLSTQALRKRILLKCEQTATKNKTWEKLNMKKAKERCLTGNYTAKEPYEE